jgi:hypothetical protein
MPAASNRRLVSLASEIRRSTGVIPRSLAESNGMLSWRGAADGSADVDGVFTLLLLDNRRTVRRASSETVLDQQPVQFSQRRYRDPRRPQAHSRTGGRVEHPCRHHDDDTGRRFDVNDFAAGPLLDILTPNAPPIERVPAVMDLNFLPDMGRMTARLPLAARITSLPVPMPAAAAPPQSIR